MSYQGLTKTPELNIEFTYALNGFFFLKLVLSIGLTISWILQHKQRLDWSRKITINLIFLYRWKVRRGYLLIIVLFLIGCSWESRQLLSVSALQLSHLLSDDLCSDFFVFLSLSNQTFHSLTFHIVIILRWSSLVFNNCWSLLVEHTKTQKQRVYRAPLVICYQFTQKHSAYGDYSEIINKVKLTRSCIWCKLGKLRCLSLSPLLHWRIER